MREIEYRHVLKPSVEYLERCGRLMLDSSEMASFLRVSQKVLTQLASTDHIHALVGLGVAEVAVGNLLIKEEWLREALQIEPKKRRALRKSTTADE
jgi:hypothetical protein